MIERKFVASNMKEFLIEEFISKSIKNAEHSHTKLQRTPLGEKVLIYSARPGLIVGRKGQNIKQLTKVLKKKFKLENPQIEIAEVENVNLDATIMAEKIVNYLEKFGTSKFKGIGHKVMSDVVAAGAMGIEILICGKIPSSRAKTWRFYQGYLKKCGDIALTGVNVAKKVAKLKTGVVGIKVSIMPPGTILPDHMELREEKQEVIEEVKENPEGEEEKEATKEEVKEENKSEVKETPAPEKEDKKNKE